MKREKITADNSFEGKEHDAATMGIHPAVKPQQEILQGINRKLAPRRREPRMHRIGVPCILKPERITPYPAILREYGLRRKGYGGYRILLAPFVGQYVKVLFQGLGNGKDVLSGYVIDRQGNIESFAATPSSVDGYTELPVTPNSYALFATVPLSGKQPVWSNITVKLIPRRATDSAVVQDTEPRRFFIQNAVVSVVH